MTNQEIRQHYIKKLIEFKMDQDKIHFNWAKSKILRKYKGIHLKTIIKRVELLRMLNPSKSIFSKGDYVYYKDQNDETCPTIVEDVKKRKDGFWLHLENLDCKMVWVKASNCELQAEAE